MRLWTQSAYPPVPEATVDPFDLTYQERQALRAMERHASTADAARELGYSSREGVAWALRTARKKLGARNTTHAVALAIRRRII